METSNLLKPEDSDEIPSTSNKEEAHSNDTSQEEKRNNDPGVRRQNILSPSAYRCCYAAHMIALIDMVRKRITV